MEALQQIGSVTFDLSVLQSFFPDCKHITDKALRLEADGRIVRLKRGLYVANADSGNLSRELIANQLYGPSYVSMSWALRYHDLYQNASISFNPSPPSTLAISAIHWVTITIRTVQRSISLSVFRCREAEMCDFSLHRPRKHFATILIIIR